MFNFARKGPFILCFITLLCSCTPEKHYYPESISVAPQGSTDSKPPRNTQENIRHKETTRPTTSSATGRHRTSSSSSECKKIVEAAWYGYTATVKKLLEQGVDPNCEYKKASALYAAARFGRNWAWDQNLDTVKLLVEHGADLNYIHKEEGINMTPAYIAGRAGHKKTAAYLVSQGSSQKDADSGSSGYAAQEQGGLAALKLIGMAGKAVANVIREGAERDAEGLDSVIVNADCTDGILGFNVVDTFTLTGGPGYIAEPTSTTGSIMVSKGAQGIRGTYHYAIEMSGGKICTGSAEISGQNKWVTIDVMVSTCKADISENQ